MTVIWYFLYLSIIIMVGYTAISIIFRGRQESLCTVLGLSITVGAGCLAFILFWISLAGFKPSRSAFAVITIIISSVLFTLWKKNLTLYISYPTFKKLPIKDLRIAIPMLLIGIMIIIVCMHSLAFTMYEWDAFSIWGLKARVIAKESLRYEPRYFNDYSLSYSHLDYPLLVPFLISGVYAMIGQIDGQVGKIVFPVLYLAFGLLVYSGLRWKNTQRQAILLTAFIMGLPISIRWAGSGNADMALTMYYAGSILFTVKWLQDEKSTDLTMAILFTVFCSFTKNEGMALGMINIFVLFLFTILSFTRRRILGLLIFTVSVFTLLLPWLLWSKDIPRTHENYISRINFSIIIENLPRFKIIIHEFLNQGVQWHRWGSLWIMLIFIAVLGWRTFRKRYITAMWLLLVMHIGMYMFIYVITPWGINDLLNASLDRLILHITPAAIFIIGFHWAEISSC